MFLCLVSISLTGFAIGQEPGGTPQVVLKPGDPPPPKNKNQKPTPTPTPPKNPVAITTPEQVAEATIFWYSLGGGRARLDQIRKTTQERGKVTFAGDDGKPEVATYTRWVMRGDSLDKEKIRLDEEFPTARYSLLYLENKVSGLYGTTVFSPREDVARRFENQIVHGVDALLRYKENGSTLTMQPKEKLMGVDFWVVDVTDKAGRKTRFYVSAKTFRVMMLTYDDGGIMYKRKFYDYNFAQNTLVYSRTVLWAGDKQVEETEIGTVTFGQHVDDEMFKIASAS
ncbi:MAG: hypothetical protein JO053_00595 [Acidobacteria bacterium]|nr:hypothetical protein [Acidobacteriota bacterium]